MRSFEVAIYPNCTSNIQSCWCIFHHNEDLWFCLRSKLTSSMLWFIVRWHYTYTFKSCEVLNFNGDMQMKYTFDGWNEQMKTFLIFPGYRQPLILSLPWPLSLVLSELVSVLESLWPSISESQSHSLSLSLSLPSITWALNYIMFRKSNIRIETCYTCFVALKYFDYISSQLWLHFNGAWKWICVHFLKLYYSKC